MSELKSYNVVATADVSPEVVDSLGCTEWAGYDKDEVDAVLAEKDEEIARLKDKLQAAEKQTENLINGASNLMIKQDTANDKLNAEIAELKAKLEDVQASAYAESVDAGMRERRLKRALWIAHEYKAKFKRWWLHLALDVEASMIRPDTKTINRIRRKIENCKKSECKCRAKAEEYK